MRTPPLHALSVFEAVTRHGELSAAAAELNVTTGAISQQLRALQDALGFKLFVKSGRRLVVNEHGALLQSTVIDALGSIRERIRQLSALDASGEKRRILNIYVPPMFGISWLTPRIFAFLAAHPHIRLKCHTSVPFSGIDWRVADIAINMGTPPWPGFWSSLVHSVRLSPICGPQLRRGPLAIRTVADVPKHRLLHEDDGSEWRRWFALAGLPFPGEADIYLGSYAMVLRAAQEGHGVALVDELLVSQELDSGRLVQPVHLSMPSVHNYHCICREEVLKDAEIKSFIDWLTTA